MATDKKIANPAQTLVTKGIGTYAFLSGAMSTGLGLVALAGKPSKVVQDAVQENLAAVRAAEHAPLAEGQAAIEEAGPITQELRTAGEELKEAAKLSEQVHNILGGVMVLGGLISMYVGKAMFDTASAARDSRREDQVQKEVEKRLYQQRNIDALMQGRMR